MTAGCSPDICTVRLAYAASGFGEPSADAHDVPHECSDPIDIAGEMREHGPAAAIAGRALEHDLLDSPYRRFIRIAQHFSKPCDDALVRAGK